MTLSEELTWRGFVNQTTYKDVAILDGEPIRFYFGVDPSADSMHIGQLSMAIMIKHFVKAGHIPTLLVGGATGMIGDPDGKAEERQLKSIEEVEKNKGGIVAQYNSLFAGESIDVVDNYDWFKDLNYIHFLRDIGKHFSMSQLLDRDFVKSRVGEGGAGISYAEFSYSLIQGYDFLHLYREKGITLQVSGADQWGNSLSGVELIRKIEGKEAHVWTAPLVINKSTGKKFGKSEEGTIWIDPSKTSVYKFYQFWLNADDLSVGDYVKLYTDILPQEYDQLMNDFAQNPASRSAQKYLAEHVTEIVHGRERMDAVKKVTDVLFGSVGVSELMEGEVDILSKEIPVATKGQLLSDILIEANVASSKGEVRRLLEGGAISVDNSKQLTDVQIDNISLVKKGKNTFILVN